MVDTSGKQMKQWSILKNEIKYMQYSQHSIVWYVLEAKAPEGKYDTKLYKRLQVAEKRG